MSDEVDNAQEREEIGLAYAIRMASLAPLVKSTGRCLNCEDQVSPGVRWCSALCRDEHEAVRGLRK